MDGTLILGVAHINFNTCVCVHTRCTNVMYMYTCSRLGVNKKVEIMTLGDLLHFCEPGRRGTNAMCRA